MNISTALERLGVKENLLSPEEKAALDRDGYLPFPGILSQDQVDTFNSRIDELLEAEAERAGLEAHREEGTDRMANLVDKGELFSVCFTHPKILAAVAHVLRGDLKLSSLNSRAALPGQGLQALHADWTGAVSPGDYHVCNSIWLLDEFTAENGATRVVPGSHRSGKIPTDEMKNPAAPHPREKQVIAPAGTVVVFNSHTWHGGTLNRSSSRRRAMHSYFCRRDQPQQTNQRDNLRPETIARMSAAARCILDVE